MTPLLKTLRSWLFTGLLVWVPIALTAFVIHWVFRFLDDWIEPWIKVRGAGLAVLVLTTLLIGFLVQLYIGRKFFRLIDWILEKSPGVNIIYRTIRDLSRTIFSNDKSVFKEVVAIEFPCPGNWAIAFRTGDAPPALAMLADEEIVLVYVMQAFSPATGFLIAVPKSKCRALDIGYEDAMKLVITGGMVRKADL